MGAAEGKIQIVTPDDDEIQIPLSQAVGELAIDHEYLGFFRKGNGVGILINGVKLFELLASLFGHLLEALRIVELEMLAFDGVGF